jgi:XTP/dITP diphosphohydrolase
MAELVDWPVIADDSGIEIEALGEHFPGVHTARFAKSLSEDYSIVLMKILAMMKGVSNRKASYHCCICYYDKKVGKPLFFEGVCEGSILEEVKGNNGFGYDPIFHYDKGNLDFGLASEEEKNKVSHRAMALKKLAVYLSI